MSDVNSSLERGGARVAFDKIACTGGSGRLGRFVVNRLAGKCEVTIVDLLPPGISADPNVRYIRSDVIDYEALKAAFKATPTCRAPGPCCRPPRMRVSSG